MNTFRSRIIVVLTLAATLLMWGAAPASAQFHPMYSVTSVKGIPGYVNSGSRAINAQNQVAANGDNLPVFQPGQSHHSGFFWDSTVMPITPDPLPPPAGGRSSNANGISDMDGEDTFIVGYYTIFTSTSLTSRGIQWTFSAGGGISSVDIGTLGGRSATATGANGADQVCGFSATGRLRDDGPTRAFLTQPGAGGIINPATDELPILQSEPANPYAAKVSGARALAVNDAGQAVGESGGPMAAPPSTRLFYRHACFWPAGGGAPEDLMSGQTGIPAGFVLGQANGIAQNPPPLPLGPLPWVAGEISNGRTRRAAAWDFIGAGWAFQNVHAALVARPPAAGATILSSIGEAVDSDGDVVGEALVRSSSGFVDERAFGWNETQGVVWFSALTSGGQVIADARGINDTGEIAAKQRIGRNGGLSCILK